MDFLASLGQTPLSAIVPYLTAAIAIATIILNVMPQPGATASAAYVALWNTIHIIANLKSPPAAPSTEVPAVSPKTLPAWALVLMLAATASLGACTPAEEAQAMQTFQVLCQVNGTMMPAVAQIAKAAGGVAAQAADVDTLLVHPAITAACAQMNGQVVAAFPAGAFNGKPPQ